MTIAKPQFYGSSIQWIVRQQLDRLAQEVREAQDTVEIKVPRDEPLLKLRDTLALEAMKLIGIVGRRDEADLATKAYKLADAMLVARAKEKA